MQKRIGLFIVFLLVFSPVVNAGPTKNVVSPEYTVINPQNFGGYGAENNLPAGDVDGNVLPDTLVSERGTPTYTRAGIVHIESGNPNGLPPIINLANSKVKIMGEPGEGIGKVMAAVGKINADKLSDFIISRTMPTSLIEAVLVYGDPAFPSTFPLKSVGVTRPGVVFKNIRFNNAVSADFRGIGKNDIVIGSGLNGEFYYVRNESIPANGTIDLNNPASATKFVFPGNAAGATVSLAVADSNCDGTKDLIVTNPTNKKVARLNIKAIYLNGTITLSDSFFNGTNGTIFSTTANTEAELAFGFPDVTTDGCDDFAFSGMKYTPAGYQSIIAVAKGTPNWPASINMNLQFNNTMGFYIEGVSSLDITQNESLPKIASIGGRLAVVDYLKRWIIIWDKKGTWDFKTVVTDSVQADNTKYTLPLGAYPTMIASAENETGEISCGTNYTLHIGTIEGGSLLGHGYIIKP